MALLTDFLIGAKVCNDCKIYVTDNTTYPVYIPPSLTPEPYTFYEIALFWSKDLFVADFNQDLTAPSPGAWTITPTTGGQWYFQAFWVVNWNPLYTFALGDVVYYSDAFYYVNDPAGVLPTEPAPQYNSKWTNMTSLAASANYATFWAAAGVGNYIGYSFASVIRTCATITTTQTDCDTWYFCNTSAVTQYVAVTEVDGTAVNDFTTTGHTGTFAGNTLLMFHAGDCATVTMPHTGVFVLSVGTALDSTTPYSILYEVCDYWECYNSLIDSVLCAETDPCCDECNEVAKKAAEIKRLELNKMQALMSSLMFYISYDALTYIGVYAVSGARTVLLTKVQAIMTKLDDIIVRCGLCNGAQSSTDVISPCPDCS